MDELKKDYSFLLGQRLSSEKGTKIPKNQMTGTTPGTIGASRGDITYKNVQHYGLPIKMTNRRIFSPEEKNGLTASTGGPDSGNNFNKKVTIHQVKKKKHQKKKLVQKEQEDQKKKKKKHQKKKLVQKEQEDQNKTKKKNQKKKLVPKEQENQKDSVPEEKEAAPKVSTPTLTALNTVKRKAITQQLTQLKKAREEYTRTKGQQQKETLTVIFSNVSKEIQTVLQEEKHSWNGIPYPEVSKIN